MAQEKPTSIRILQSQKKTEKPKALLIAAGFTAGVVVSVLGFILFLKSSSNDVNHSVEAESNVVNATQANSAAAPSTVVTQPNQAVTPNSNTPNAEDDETIKQPKESELSKLFKHKPQPSQPQNTVQPSPFGPNLMPSTAANKNTATTQAKAPTKSVETKTKAHTESKNNEAAPDVLNTDKAETSLAK